MSFSVGLTVGLAVGLAVGLVVGDAVGFTVARGSGVVVIIGVGVAVSSGAGVLVGPAVDFAGWVPVTVAMGVAVGVICLVVSASIAWLSFLLEQESDINMAAKTTVTTSTKDKHFFILAAPSSFFHFSTN